LFIQKNMYILVGNQYDKKMSKRTVRVTIPIGSPSEMSNLTDDILERHNDLGPGSPLNDPELDMAGLAVQNATHKTKRSEGNTLHGQAEPLIQAADTALGVEEGQTIDTVGTVYNLTGRIRDRLLYFYPGEEEEATTFGFNVLVNEERGKRTVSMEIPIQSPKAMLELGDKILVRNAELGGGSPLNIPELDMATFASKHDLHKAKRKEGNKKHGLAEVAIQKADRALGTEEGQSKDSVGTVYNIVTRVRDKLLFVHPGEEEELTTYGFNVVVSITSLPGEGEPETHEGSVAAGATVAIVDGIEDGTALTLKNTGAVDLIFCRGDEGVPCDPVLGATVGPGAEASLSGADIGTGDWLNTTNNDSTEAGAFEVVVG